MNYDKLSIGDVLWQANLYSAKHSGLPDRAAEVYIKALVKRGMDIDAACELLGKALMVQWEIYKEKTGREMIQSSAEFNKFFETNKNEIKKAVKALEK